MIAEPGAGRPPRGGVGQHGAHVVPVAQVLGGGVVGRCRHTGGVPQHVAQGHGLLAVGAQFGPHVGDAQVVDELAPLDQDVRHSCRHPLRSRRRVEQRVGPVSSSPSHVPATASTIRWPRYATATCMPISRPSATMRSIATWIRRRSSALVRLTCVQTATARPTHRRAVTVQATLGRHVVGRSDVVVTLAPGLRGRSAGCCGRARGHGSDLCRATARRRRTDEIRTSRCPGRRGNGDHPARRSVGVRSTRVRPTAGRHARSCHHRRGRAPAEAQAR